MKKQIKILTLSAIAAILLNACGSSIDENKLAELTGNKNFEQIKQSYILSVTTENKADQEIYTYWLKENGAKDQPSFSFDTFKKNIDLEYKKQIDLLKAQMAKISENVQAMILKSKETNSKWEIDYRKIRDLKSQRMMYNYSSGNSSFIKNTYLPFLNTQIQLLKDEIERKKQQIKDERAAFLQKWKADRS